MAKWEYRKPEPSDVRGLCCHCGENLQKKKSNGKYQTLCSGCERRKYQSPESKETRRKWARENYKNYSYRRFKTNTCEMCGFKSDHKCQFDVDHIDGDHSNNCLTNLQTLCANCHRLKTMLNGEGIYRPRK